MPGAVRADDALGAVAAPRIAPAWPRGVLPALEAWLRTEAGRRFRVRRELEAYGVSCHPSGFLQRVA